MERWSSHHDPLLAQGCWTGNNMWLWLWSSMNSSSISSSVNWRSVFKLLFWRHPYRNLSRNWMVAWPQVPLTQMCTGACLNLHKLMMKKDLKPDLAELPFLPILPSSYCNAFSCLVLLQPSLTVCAFTHVEYLIVLWSIAALHACMHGAMIIISELPKTITLQ